MTAPIELFDDFDREMIELAELLTAAVKEAGFHDAEVWYGGTGLFVDGAPDEALEKALALYEISENRP